MYDEAVTMTTTITAILLGGALLLGFAAAFVFLRRRGALLPDTDKGMLLLQQQVSDLARSMDQKLSDSMRHAQESTERQFARSQTLIQEITRELTKMSEGRREVVDIAKELQSLKNVLQNPKQRGVLGEFYLKELLENVLPPGRFALQYEFANGEKVDAVIFLDKGKMLPIDSKFSLENYNRLLEESDAGRREELEKSFKQDLKNRIDETGKYIRPQEGTMDFAFMFIPSEAIYYDLLVNKVGAVKTSARDLIEYAFRQKHVLIVSPTSFMAYLQTVLQGLRALQIEESAKEIRKHIEGLHRHLATYEGYIEKVGKNLGATVGAFNSAQKEFKKIDKDILNIAGDSMEFEPELLDRPDEVV